MPDKEQNSQNDFMIEKIKTRPINRKKLIRRTIITAAMAVIFGLIACFTFLLLEPVISNWLYPEEEAQIVVFPEDQEEMSPEEMLAENLPAESPVPAPEQEDGPMDEQERIQQLLSEFVLDKDHYAQLYSALRRYIYTASDEEGAASLKQNMVVIRGITSNIDWFDNVQESSYQASGLIVADNGRELLILVDYTSLQGAESLVLDPGDGSFQIEAELKGLDADTNLAIVGAALDNIPPQWLDTGGLAVANLGSSNGNNLAGTPVIAMGSPMGTGDSIGYGMITSANTQWTEPDRSYKILLTDINGSKNAEGVLFNLQGQVVGVITRDKTAGDMGNVIQAYGISEMKKIIQKLSNQSAFAYLGITGVNVTKEAHENIGVPYGAYVTELEMDSPAMLAGIQAGDVISAMNGNAVSSFNVYTSMLMDLDPGQTAELTVWRQAQDEYREMSFSVELAELTN